MFKITVADKYGMAGRKMTYEIESDYLPEAANMARNMAHEDGLEKRWNCITIIDVEEI